jgi:hypothetical protein
MATKVERKIKRKGNTCFQTNWAIHDWAFGNCLKHGLVHGGIP